MRLIGHVDEVDHGHVTGWAADADQPTGVVSVMIVVDGEVRGEVAAAGFRHGLRHVCPGATGQYEFKYQFAPAVSNDAPHVIEVLEVATGQLVANGRRWLPASGSVRRDPIPVLITSTGRSGTTMLMHEFFPQEQHRRRRRLSVRGQAGLLCRSHAQGADPPKTRHHRRSQRFPGPRLSRPPGRA